MKRKVGISAVVLALLLTASAAAAPLTGGVTLTGETAGITATEEDGVFAVTAPAGKRPAAISADGSTVYLAGNQPIKEELPVTTMASHTYQEYIAYRQPLTNTYKKLTENKALTVVYFGGSVTMGYKSSHGGWRGLSGNWLKEQFPQADITLINAGLGESGTFMGTYRVQNDVIAQNPDLVFVEYAINDKYKGSTQEQAASQYETVVREIKRALPTCDIVTLLVTDSGVAPLLPELYPTAAGHAAVAEAYHIPVINVGAALVNHMEDYTNKDEWNRYFWDGVHPKDEGYAVYFDCLKEYLTNTLLNTDYSDFSITPSILPPVQSESLLDGNRVSAFGKDMENYIVADQTEGFTYSEERFNGDNDTKHYGYYGGTGGNNDKITIRFTGTELAIWTNFYNTSQYMYTVDGGELKFSKGARHAPTQVVSGLEPGEHEITILPFIYGGESGGKMTIGALFIRDESKQSVKGDVHYSTAENRLSLRLPAGSFAVQYVPLNGTAAELPTPQAAPGKQFAGWRTADGKLLQPTDALPAEATLTAVFEAAPATFPVGAAVAAGAAVAVAAGGAITAAIRRKKKK